MEKSVAGVLERTGMGHDGDGRCRTKDHALPGEAARHSQRAGRTDQAH